MKIYITYDVTTSMTLTVERDSIPEDHDELLESVTKQELMRQSNGCRRSRMGQHQVSMA